MNIAIAVLAMAALPLCASLSAIPAAGRGVLVRLSGHTFAANLNWGNADDVTALGTVMQVLSGVVNVDLPGDIRDNVYNLTHWNQVSTSQKIIDAVGLIPIIGALKYADEAGDVLKGGSKAADAVRSSAKNPAEIVQPTARVLQTGGHTLSSSTVKQLGLSKDQAKGALETLKKENIIPNSAHGKIMDNGDYVIDGQIVDNLKNYIK